MDIGRAVAVGIAGALGTIILLLVIACIVALPTMLIVNYVLSSSALATVFGGPLTFWKAFWLNVGCGILFKGSASIRKSSE